MQNMEEIDIERSKAFSITGAIDYVANSVVIKTIIKKPTGNVSLFAFDAGEELPGKYSPFDNLVQVIEGSAEILINDSANMLEAGQAIIIPAHSRNTLKAKTRFKMLSTFIKSGYED